MAANARGSRRSSPWWADLGIGIVLSIACVVMVATHQTVDTTTVWYYPVYRVIGDVGTEVVGLVVGLGLIGEALYKRRRTLKIAAAAPKEPAHQGPPKPLDY